MGEEKCTPRENYWYAYEERAFALRWYGAPKWLIRPWMSLNAYSALHRDYIKIIVFHFVSLFLGME